jgi:guanylate cyclase
MKESNMTSEPESDVVKPLIRRLFPFVARIGVGPDDSDEVRLRKASLVLGSLMFIVAGALWGILYWLFDQALAGAIPFSYTIVSFLSVVLFHVTRRYAWFLFSQLLLILLLPFLLMIALGGFISSSAVILWSLICPLAAFLFVAPRRLLAVGLPGSPGRQRVS